MVGAVHVAARMEEEAVPAVVGEEVRAEWTEARLEAVVEARAVSQVVEAVAAAG